jgi:altronate dehydratase small subunit
VNAVAGAIQAGADALVVDVKDDVATALREIQSGEIISYRSGEIVEQVEALDPIPFGHKLAIRPVAAAGHVRKYGEVIGQATVNIEVGRHVHVHNVEGIRGRGDQAGGES